VSTIYNDIGSWTFLKSKFNENRIFDFQNLEDVLDFQEKFNSIMSNYILEQENLLLQEKSRLEIRLSQLFIEINQQKKIKEREISDRIKNFEYSISQKQIVFKANAFQKMINYMNVCILNFRLKIIKISKQNKINRSVEPLETEYQRAEKRFRFLSNHFSEAVTIKIQPRIKELERKNKIIAEYNTYVIGAIGEQQIVSILQKLSDEYYVINDFQLNFRPALYWKKENGYIKSIQVDHLLISPSGIFLIETKNWSKNSMENVDLRPPTLQIQRSSYAFYRFVNSKLTNKWKMHLWGSKKIQTRNIIAMINSKPNEEFQFVKILNPLEILRYVQYFDKQLSPLETISLVGKLNELNGAVVSL